MRLHTLGRPTRSLYRMVIGLGEQFLSKSAAIREPIYGLAELDFGLGKEEEGEKGRNYKIGLLKGEKCSNSFQLTFCCKNARQRNVPFWVVRSAVQIPLLKPEMDENSAAFPRIGWRRLGKKQAEIGRKKMWSRFWHHSSLNWQSVHIDVRSM